MLKINFIPLEMSRILSSFSHTSLKCIADFALFLQWLGDHHQRPFLLPCSCMLQVETSQTVAFLLSLGQTRSPCFNSSLTIDRVTQPAKQCRSWSFQKLKAAQGQEQTPHGSLRRTFSPESGRNCGEKPTSPSWPAGPHPPPCVMLTCVVRQPAANPLHVCAHFTLTDTPKAAVSAAVLKVTHPE